MALLLLSETLSSSSGIVGLSEIVAAEEHAAIDREKVIKQMQEKVLLAELSFKDTIYSYLNPPKRHDRKLKNLSRLYLHDPGLNSSDALRVYTYRCFMQDSDTYGVNYANRVEHITASLFLALAS